MIVISFETCFKSTSVSLYIQDKSIFETLIQVREAKQSESLATLTQSLIEKHNLLPENISTACVNIGPGSFTGIRIGLSFLEGLSFGLKDMKKYYVSSFGCILGGLDSISSEVYVILQAIRETFYIQLFSSKLEPLSAPEYKTKTEVEEILERKKVKIYGNFNGFFSNYDVISSQAEINSNNLIKCFLKHKHLCYNTNVPLYLRAC